MNLFLLLNGISNVFFHCARSSLTGPRDCERRRMAWSVGSPKTFAACSGRSSVLASNSAALQSPPTERTRLIDLFGIPWAMRSLAASEVYSSLPEKQSVTNISFWLVSGTIYLYMVYKKGTLVRVPVLSEQITETAPRVSTVARDLQRILFFFIIPAAMVRPMEIEIGRPSGIKAIPTLTQLTMRVGTSMKSGWSLRRYPALDACQQVSISLDGETYQIIMMMITKVIMKEAMIKTNRRISFCMGVNSVLRPLDRLAMRPNTVWSPVPTTMPSAAPEMQYVPCRPILFVSRKLLLVESTDPGTGSDSPRQSAKHTAQPNGVLTSQDRSIKLDISRSLNQPHIRR